MEFTAVAAALVRRWYVTLLGLALTAGLVYTAHDMVPPTYTAAASVLLLPPGASVPDGSNPMLALGGLEQPAALVVAYLAGDSARQQFAEQYPNAAYDIVVDPLSRGPLVLITMKDPDPGETMDALNAVLTTLPDALTKLQDQVDAPQKSRVTSMPLSVDVAPTTDRSDSKRALIAAAGVGLVLTLVSAVAFDSLAIRRRERRKAKAAAAAEAAASAAAAAALEASALEPAAPVETAPSDEGTAPVGSAASVDTAADSAPTSGSDDADESDAGASPVEALVDVSTDDPFAGVHQLHLSDFTRSEELYGSTWPPRVGADAALDDDIASVSPRP